MPTAIVTQKLERGTPLKVVNGATTTGTSTGGSLGSTVFTGSGLNDGTLSGTPTTNGTFTVTIDATGTPDTFTWKLNGLTRATGVAITGSAQTLSNGVSVTFGATTGHTLAASWSATATLTGVFSSVFAVGNSINASDLGTCTIAPGAGTFSALGVGVMISLDGGNTFATLVSAINLGSSSAPTAAIEKILVPGGVYQLNVSTFTGTSADVWIAANA